MTVNIKKIAGLMILAGMLGLTACDSSNQNAASPTTAPTVAPTEVAATAQPQPEITTSPAPTDAPAATAAATNGPNTATASPQAAAKQLKELLELAKQGKVPGVEYAAHNGLIDDVKAAWGEPDREEAAGSGIYSTYTDKHVVFGFNKGSQIYDVRSSEASLQQLTLKQIEGALGKPHEIKENGKDKIYTYEANKQYQLKFIIPESTGTVDHISVFSEQDSINNMAG
ncbi:YjgB family protein [Paenibacillus monticola]|uniref:DUF4309 domain-containing protein n=1 Tax=Paenibacillus monticola TaxID=2666075 RepID=A0A7X2H196_9BACL|nr:YjgB family protein [Paenibacillus monticola]MRN51719.1 DUF4309 domain-containing protein [Paenibacillus monticola]